MLVQLVGTGSRLLSKPEKMKKTKKCDVKPEKIEGRIFMRLEGEKMDTNTTTKIVTAGAGILTLITKFVDDVGDDFRRKRYVQGSFKIACGVIVVGGTGYVISICGNES